MHSLTIEEALLEQITVASIINKPTGNERLYPLHEFIGQGILNELPINDGYSVKGLGMKDGSGGQVKIINGITYNKGKEDKVPGNMYSKKVDISVRKNGVPKGVALIKSVGSNYSQNSINYFESMLGESINLLDNGVVVGQIFCCPKSVPYYNKSHVITAYQSVVKKDIEKYVKMSKRHNILTCVVIYEINNNRVSILNLPTTFGISSNSNLLTTTQFIKEVAIQCQ